jgi:hypothetical protein
LITNSTIDNNQSGSRGGGIVSYGYVVVSNSTISSNVTAVLGGGIYSSGEPKSSLSITNSTVAFNQASLGGDNGGGGGVYVGAGSVSINSSIIATNANAGASDVGCQNAGVATSGSNNLIGAINGCAAGLTMSSQDPQLTPLSNHGGPTRTHALLSTSPAIHAGSDASGLSYDQRGVGFPRVQTVGQFDLIDIGAYERQPLDDEIFYDGFLSPGG